MKGIFLFAYLFVCFSCQDKSNLKIMSKVDRGSKADRKDFEYRLEDNVSAYIMEMKDGLAITGEECGLGEACVLVDESGVKYVSFYDFSDHDEKSFEGFYTTKEEPNKMVRFKGLKNVVIFKKGTVISK